MGKVIRAFCWYQKFVPKGLYALDPGLYTCIKSLKMCIKSDFEKIILKLAAYGQREKVFLLSSKFCPQWIVCPCLGLYTCGKTWKNVSKPAFKEFVLKFTTNGQSDKGFILTSTFGPKGLSAPVLGLYTCMKALKYIPGPGVRWAFTGPLVLWCWFCHEAAHIKLKTNQEQLSHGTRKSVLEVCDQLRLKPACSADETGQGLQILAITSRDIILSRQWTTKMLIRLRRCAGWSAPLLFTYGINRFSHDMAQVE